MPTVCACPDRLTLERLLLGQVPLPEAEALEAHVSSCSQCATTIQGLKAEDVLVIAMRQARNKPVHAAAEGAEAIIPWLKRLQRKAATAVLHPAPIETQTVEVSPTSTEMPLLGSALPTYDFLSPPQQPDELGRLEQYRVLQAIGVGGMGMVFRAEDTQLRRQVALKVIKPELLVRYDLHERFLTEARAIAAVEHDNIVVIYEVGDAKGVPYLVMPLLRGESLEDFLKREDRPLPVDELLRLGGEIAAGLDAAHQCGLVHRDIKPSNLWLEMGGEKGKATELTAQPSVPRIKILDFGLARTVDATNEEGERHPILGTPAYMSPEQGRGLPADARSDLFSLGCVLYRMATGRAPFQGRDVVTAIMSVATETPVSAKELNPKLPADLVALIEKLLAKKPEERFVSAQEVVAAIRAIERSRQPKRIGRWLTVLAACVGLAIAGSFGMSAYLHRPPPPVEIAFNYDEPDTKLMIQRDEEHEQEIDVKQTPQLMLPPGTYVIRTKAEHQERTLWPTRFVVNEHEPREVLLSLVGLIRANYNHTLPITAVAFSPREGSFLALAASQDRSVSVWNTNADASFFLRHDSWVHCVAFSPDGKLALSGSGMRGRKPDNSVRVWDLNTRQCIDTLAGHESSVTAVAYDPKGKTLLSGDQDGRVFFWDAQTHKRIDAVQGHNHLTVHSLAFLPDGKQAVSAGGDTRLALWDVDKRQVLRMFEGHTKTIKGVCASPDGQHAVTSSDDGTIRIWNLQTGVCHVIEGHKNGVCCIAYSPDGKRLLSGGEDGTVRLWDVRSGEAIHVFTGHRKTVYGVAFSADGRRAISASADVSLRLWELPR